MLATVVKIHNGHIDVMVRRGHRVERLDRPDQSMDLRIGDKVEVRRQVNNPYLIRVRD